MRRKKQLEYVTRKNIFGIKIMMKSGLEKIFFKYPKPFSNKLVYNIKRRIFAQSYKFSNINHIPKIYILAMVTFPNDRLLPIFQVMRNFETYA